MSNRHSFKLQFDGRIRSNCRGLNNIKIDQDYEHFSISSCVVLIIYQSVRRRKGYQI